MAPGISISLKAFVDKESNKVIFIESGNDFIDVLFSFLTIPIGTIVKLARNHSVPVEIGCMKNLYQSVEKIDLQDLRSNACRDMLLLPRNAAESHCKNLKLKIDNGQPTHYFLCSRNCTDLLVAYDKNTPCPYCLWEMNREKNLSVAFSQVGGIFVKGRAGLTITDDLQVMPPLSAASISLFTKLGVKDGNTTEVLTLDIGFDEVLSLLMSSLVSKTPLTETLLKNKSIPNLVDLNFNQGVCIGSQMFEDTMIEEDENISVKLIVSKSKKMLCYAEAREDFVNLLFSFLTLPLGFILKQIQNGSLKGCIDQLYKSVQELDEQHLNSNYHKEILVTPKLVPGFCYENNLLGIEQASYYYVGSMLTADRSLVPSDQSLESVKVKVMDPKALDDNDKNARGFLKGPAMFTVTDNLDVRPISTIYQLSVLNDLKVSFTDIEDRIVHVGRKEAVRLLVASFVCDSALTNTFIRELKVPKQEK